MKQFKRPDAQPDLNYIVDRPTAMRSTAPHPIMEAPHVKHDSGPVSRRNAIVIFGLIAFIVGAAIVAIANSGTSEQQASNSTGTSEPAAISTTTQLAGTVATAQPFLECATFADGALTPEDCIALASLINAAPRWIEPLEWGYSDDPCVWSGVVCEDGMLTKLILINRDLTSEIPPEIGNLPNLRELDLGVNQLTGEIPREIGNLTNLEVLDLSSNQLTGEIPPEIGNLTDLEVLVIDHSGTGLGGEIPSEVFDLTSLERLIIASIDLRGEIPPEIGNLTNLRTLALTDNSLSGEIPSEIGNLTNLVTLGLSYNEELHGVLPEELAAVQSLGISGTNIG